MHELRRIAQAGGTRERRFHCGAAQHVRAAGTRPLLRLLPRAVGRSCHTAVMTEDQMVQSFLTARDAAAAQRDEAVETVSDAFRARARRWLTWAAYGVADRNADKVDQAAVVAIKKVVDELAVEAEDSQPTLNYGAIFKDQRDATSGGAAHIIDQATNGHLVTLGQRLRQLGLPPGQDFPDDSSVSRFSGQDNFWGLLEAWAGTETALRRADRDYRAAKDRHDKANLRQMWGDDAPPPDSDARGVASMEW